MILDIARDYNVNNDIPDVAHMYNINNDTSHT